MHAPHADNKPLQEARSLQTCFTAKGLIVVAAEATGKGGPGLGATVMAGMLRPSCLRDLKVIVPMSGCMLRIVGKEASSRTLYTKQQGYRSLSGSEFPRI